MFTTITPKSSVFRSFQKHWWSNFMLCFENYLKVCNFAWNTGKPHDFTKQEIKIFTAPAQHHFCIMNYWQLAGHRNIYLILIYTVANWKYFLNLIHINYKKDKCRLCACLRKNNFKINVLSEWLATTAEHPWQCHDSGASALARQRSSIAKEIW